MRFARGQLPALLPFILAFALGILFVVWQANSELEWFFPYTPTPGTAVPEATEAPVALDGTPEAESSTRTPVPRPKVGIVAGHWKHDSGAVCPDGLQEVDINFDIADRVKSILQQEGYDAEVLPEFGDHLKDYQADALISLHADSCEFPSVSGFKVARLAGSRIPDVEDRLVNCLVTEYGAATGLVFHQNTITEDMTEYHAFGEIAPETPGAIIELGFLAGDREILVDGATKVAQGVVRGVLCFLEGP